VRRSWTLIASTLLLAIVASQCGDGRLSETVGAEEVLADLAPSLAPARPQVLLHTGRRAPARLAHVTNPGEPLIAHVTVPAAGALEVGFGIGQHEDGAAGGPLRFSVAVDGTEMMTRTLDPSLKRDRRWQSARVDLKALAGRDVKVDAPNRTSWDAGTRPGMPGWTRVHLVRVATARRRGSQRRRKRPRTSSWSWSTRFAPTRSDATAPRRARPRRSTRSPATARSFEGRRRTRRPGRCRP
jgi:hypothetical protein